MKHFLSALAAILFSCSAFAQTDTIINKYAAVLSRGNCDNSLVVDTATNFNVGDTVLMIQMKGADIDSSNTAAFGTVLNYNGAGNYELNVIKAKTGNTLILKYKIVRPYNIPNGRVQLVRVPYYQNYIVNQPHTCLPWTGTKGGVVMINVANTLTLNDKVDVTGRGFKGGPATYATPANCNQLAFFYPAAGNSAGRKGEGITEVGIGKIYGRGPLGNGGGGGNSHNAGGGGGGNGAIGGLGGNQYNYFACAAVITPVIGGVGGNTMPYSAPVNKLFVGGGGGSGHGNDVSERAGANGGGICIIRANTLIGNAKQILADGNSSIDCPAAAPGCQDDGGGGGGAGGTIISAVTTYNGNITTSAKGGKGSIAYISVPANGGVGPGGGGSGGVVWFAQAAVPAAATTIVTGGLNGVLPQLSNNAWGAQPGSNGQTLTNYVLALPVDTFKANQLTVDFIDSVVSCNSRKFKDQTTTTTTGIATWSWNFGGSNTSALQNPTFTFVLDGTYPVKLVVTDSNGCKDSITKNIVIGPCNDLIINKYAAVLARGTCDNSLLVDTATNFNVGDTVLMIQMKGADIDSGNTAAFGNILNYNGAGNYEWNVIKAKTGNTLILKYKIVRTYNIPNGRVQLVRVPYYQNYSMNQPHTCLPWTGTKGGVFAVNVANTLTMNNKIDVSGRGFTGGQINNGTTYTCDKTDYYYPAASNDGGIKGEGITEVSAARIRGMGKLANGGGGGNSTNAGGAGGGNGGVGGLGGHQWQNCNTTLAIGGVGGAGLGYTPSTNKLFLGGGGGCGHENNADTDPGGNGGGLVFVNATTLAGNNNLILTNGNNCVDNFALPPSSGDGQSGGGAGGTVFMKVTSYTSNPAIEAKGGNGGNVYAGILHGTGGGGGGGAVVFSAATLPAAAVTTTGGANGIVTLLSSAHFATGGQQGTTVAGYPYILPIDTFRNNVLHADFTDSVAGCYVRKFKDQSTFTTTGIASWSWNFGGSSTSTLQNPTFTFAGVGTYPVKLVVTDSNGCKDSITKNIVIAVTHFANAGPDKSICKGVATTITASGGTTYSWSPVAGLGTPNAATTTANPAVTTPYIVTVTNNLGCIDHDTMLLTVNVVNAFAGNDTDICLGTVATLHASGGGAYAWSPAAGLSNPNSAVTTANTNVTTQYIVTVTGTNLCVGKDTMNVTVHNNPVAYAGPDTSTCPGVPVTLTANGGVNYTWSPGATLSSTSTAATDATPTVATIYIVTVTDAYNCTGKDSVLVTLKPVPIADAGNGQTVCPGILVNLLATGGAAYSWSPAAGLSNPNSAATTATPAGTTKYIVTVTGTNGCSNRDSITITVLPAPTIAASPNSYTGCNGGKVKLNATGGITYSWSPAAGLDNANIAAPTATVTGNAHYIVTGTDANGCTNTDSVDVIDGGFIVIDATSDGNGISCYRRTVQLFATGALSYRWHPGAYCNDSTIPSPTVNPPITTTFTIEGVDADGCRGRDTITVISYGDYSVYIPNAFTPNSDGINDDIKPSVYCGFHFEEFLVFNRWGENVFTSNNLSLGWDGTYKGAKAPLGVYHYLIKGKKTIGNLC